MALPDIVGQIVTGLGYELIEIDRSTGGLLRVTIDLPWSPGSELFVNVEDCEKVTRQLLFALEVEEIEYKRLEVSSPGIDRPLRTEQDFERFAGEEIDVTLKAPRGAAAAGQVAANRKKFRGTLERRDVSGGLSGWPTAAAGRSPGAMRRRSSPARRSARKGSRRRCRHWASRSMSSGKPGSRRWWISRGAAPGKLQESRENESRNVDAGRSDLTREERRA